MTDIERAFYCVLVSRQSSRHDRIVIAWLSGASKRHARWQWPTPEERAAALTELREIATVDGKLRPDLLAMEAGLRLGLADVRGDPYGLQDAIAGTLLLEAGAAPPELVEEWRDIGHLRARPVGTGDPRPARKT